jgi:hypothetical protein
MRTALPSFLFLLASFASSTTLVGCGWRHASGHEARSAMTRIDLPSRKPQMCLDGLCDLEGPEGAVHFSNVAVEASNSARTSTAFDLAYRESRAVCVGPTKDPEQHDVPFACAITDAADARGAKHILVLDAGCTRGTLREITPEGEKSLLGVSTDRVTVLGHVAPGREVALAEGEDVLFFSDAPNPHDRVIFAKRSKAPSRPELLALVALHAFNGIEGTPRECLATK